jgi:hypothetical protein
MMLSTCYDREAWTPYHASPATPPAGIAAQGGVAKFLQAKKAPLLTTAQNGSAVNGPDTVCPSPPCPSAEK